jgi:cyclophilin family peptidyl-prolyl cis-trans isomerase
MLRPRVKSSKPQSDDGSSSLSPSAGSTDGKRTNRRFVVVATSAAIVLVSIIALLTWRFGGSQQNDQIRTSSTTSPNGRRSKLRVTEDGATTASSSAAANNKNKKNAAPAEETLVLSTSVGDLRIVLRPDLSTESVEYVKQVVRDNKCSPCNLYRVEEPGIVQGILKNPRIALPTVKGPCPAEQDAEDVPNDCPEWDKSCGCHGPVMTHGMVGWAAGATGPDFFVDAYQRPARWWGTQHTVWGQIKDEASWSVIDAIRRLPSKRQGDLTYLVDPLHFDLRIE